LRHMNFKVHMTQAQATPSEKITMKTGNTLPYIEIRLSSLLLFLALILTNCQDTPLQVPTKDEFTKEKREALGKMIANDISYNFEILPESEPYDSLHWYTQTLYNQATNIMKLDNRSPVDNRWNPDREWKVRIINDDHLIHAFALPGGDFYVTTGLLKSLDREHEYFFIATFEATIMHEGYLLSRLIEEYNSLTINNLIEGRDTGNQITLEDVASDLPILVFDDNTTQLADEATVSSICNTSILEPTGVNPILLNPDFQGAKWLQTRPSYGNRTSKVLDFASDNSGDCGGSTGGDNYQKFVLDILAP